MTVTVAPRYKRFNGNDTTGPFSFTFPILLSNTGTPYITVKSIDADGVETELAYPADYSITPLLLGKGGAIINTTVAIATGEQLYVEAATPLDQLISFRNQGEFSAESHENGFDKIHFILIENVQKGDLAIKFPSSEIGVDTVLPVKSLRMNTTLGFDANGDIFCGAISSVLVSAAMVPFVQSATVADARTELGLGGLAVKDTINNSDWLGDVLSVANGGTGADNAEDARANLGIEVDTAINGFRLTLTSGTPVTTADVTAASTIYLTPFKSNRIALNDGTSWNIYTSAQVSLALSGLTNNQVYDLFVYANGANIALESLAWSSATARATGISFQDGVYVKAGDITRRYVGTFRATGVSTTENSKAMRRLWNYNNRAEMVMEVLEATDSWTYTTNSYRLANNSATNILDFVVGVAEDAISAKVLAAASNASSVTISVGIGVDSTTSNGAVVNNALVSSAAHSSPCTAEFLAHVGIGGHYLSWLERSEVNGTTTWYGDGTLVIPHRCGIFGSIKG